MNPEEPIGAEEAAKMLGVTARTVTRLADQGKLPGFRVGRLWKFRPSVIEEYIRRQEQKHDHRQADDPED